MRCFSLQSVVFICDCVFPPCFLTSVDSATQIVCQMIRSKLSFYPSQAQLPGIALQYKIELAQ